MVPSGDVHPLSSAQEQLWFIDQLRSGAAIEYLLSATLRLRGNLDVAALTAALTEIAARHAVLRSRFDSVDGAAGGTAVQVVTDPAPVELSHVDISGRATAEQDLREIRLCDLRTPIDLRTQPPWRVTLVRVADDEVVLLIAVHHIAFDGMSWSVLARELGALYGAAAGRESAPLPSPAIQYHDAVRNQLTRQESGHTAGLEHWAARLAGLAPLELPTDHPRPEQWVADGDCVDLTVPADLARRLRELGRTHRASPFMVHLAAYQLLLARYSGQDDVAVGVSVSTRRNDELPLIGMFLNTVVLRGDLSGEPSFSDLVGQARKTALDAYAHQDVPFDQVITRLAPERDPSRNPLFQAGIAWYDARRQPYHLPGLDVTLCSPLWASSAFDLSLHLAQDADGSVHGQLIYPTSLFDRPRIERMAANYVRLLTELAARPAEPAHALELVADAELAALRDLGAADTGAYEESLPDLFFAQARRSPDATAVVSDVDELTYAQLAARVDALACHLRSLGVGTETPVGVALDRGADLVTAVLAILTAGGTYVPLPTDHPAARLRHVLADTGATLVLTHSTTALPDAPARVNLDEPWDTGAPADRPVIHGAQLAYVVHTSGSTGRPKGVAVTHDGIRNRVLWSVRNQLTADDRVLQKTTIGFDAAMWELLTPLVTGATLVMAPPDAHRDPAVMAAAITRHGATVLQLVPSVLRLLLEEPGFADCTSLRLVCSAGEALPTALCRRLTALLEVEIDNTYGPTECAIDATAWRYRRDQAGATVPIGAPLTNNRVFIVDERDRLVPVGVPGELCVSGTGLARGYLGRPDQTARQFTPHPYPLVPGERWYRTGDLARWRDDGSLEFVGRVDHQVKINGVRIEPAEIESALCAHPGVSAAAVVTHRTPAGDTTLVAYAVPTNGATPADLHDHLAARLPAPMVPPVINTIGALPLGPNGKLDRAALPAPAEESTSDGPTEPRTPTERAVAGAMAELLGREEVGARDDFFVLGGHSLLAIRLVLRLRRAFGVELTIGELFDDRTVERLAARIDAGTATTGNAIRPVPRDDALPLSFAQRRMWFLDQLDPGSVEYLIPLALRVHGPFDVAAFQHAVDRVAARHEVLRTRYAARDGEPVQVVDPPGPVSFDHVDLTGMPDAATELLDRVSSRPFHLTREHPLRVTVVRVAADEHLVALTLHHIAFDAWSMEILFRDLNDAYQAADGRPLAVQYADFAVWQRSEQSAQDLAQQVDYWRDRLAGLTPLELTTDRPRPAQRDPHGESVSVTVPPPVAQAVTELAARQGATPFMTLLAAFQLLLGRYTGRTDISVGTPVAGRTRQETEELLGFFTNTLVLRADLAGDPTFTELLDQVRRSCTEAFANQDVPFEHLVDAVAPDRDLSRNPLFQIMFELEQLDRRPGTLCGFAAKPIRSGTPVAKFDLTVSVQQRPGGELRCVFEYATSLFDRGTVERMAGHYLRLLASVGAGPDTPLSDVDMIGDDERRLLLHEWPDPEGDRLESLDPAGDHGLCLPELVERQAVLWPDAVAAINSADQLTYAELDARATRFARLLRTRGVRQETVVGVCLERSLDAVVVLLGVLKAGGVYTPFDPRHPAARLDFMLTDAGARVVVTTREFADRFGGREVVTVDGDWSQRSDVDAGDLPRPDPRGLAYIIYTSGSTGRPKGVMTEHRSYAHHCRVIADAYTIGPDDRVVLLSALTFDVAMDQIGATLVVGATIVVSDPLFWTPAELPARLAEYGVTIMDITPAYYREAMRHGPEQLAGLRLMNVGADAVTVDDARRWAATGHPGRFLCSYGPTEATICSLLHPVTGDLAGQRAGATLPIGRTVPGTRAYIVDADLRLVPAGVPGELCLGGVRLARGYHNRAALTAERFVPDPFGPPGSRLYRTGDLVRHHVNGDIEFLGRIDQQVKIRGLRIELGEVEAALLRHADVDAAVVVTATGPSGDPRLDAYLVGRPGAEPGVDVLRAHLRALLPEYMIPARWATLAALPMTASGKVNRKALTAGPTAELAVPEAEAPRDPTEQLIADIWREVLGVDRVGVTDDFFVLGGHSLLATRVLAQLRRVFAVELPLRRLFEATTVADLANAVRQAVEDEVAGLSDAEVAELLSSEGV